MMLYSHLAEPSMVYNISSPSACLEQRNPINHHPPPMSAYFHWVVWAMRMTSVLVRRWIEEGGGGWGEAEYNLKFECAIVHNIKDDVMRLPRDF